jgi:hypothetical protein
MPPASGDQATDQLAGGVGETVHHVGHGIERVRAAAVPAVPAVLVVVGR